MLAATYTQGKSFEVTDIPEPKAAPDELLLKIRSTSICGTDVKILKHGHRKLKAGQTIVLGHEFVGEVHECGEQVTGFKKGQRVGVAPNAGCGVCDSCISGTANYCADYTAFGIDRDGGHAPFMKVPGFFVRQGNVIPLPDSISDIEGSVLEPFSCVVNGIRISHIELGDTVVVFGAGPIGRMHIMLAKISGAARVIAADISAKCLGKALELGADIVIDSSKENVRQRIMELTQNRGANVIITACPVASVQEEAVGLLAPFGRLCLFGGLPNGSDGIKFDSNAVHYKNLVITGCTGGSLQDYHIAMRLVETHKVDLSKIVSDTFALSELAAAYQKAQSGPDGKITLVNR